MPSCESPRRGAPVEFIDNALRPQDDGPVDHPAVERHRGATPGRRLQQFEMYVWHGLYAPKGTPQPVIARLGTALREALKDPNVKSKFGDLGAEPVSAEKATPEGLQTHLKAEIDKWGPIYKKAGAFAD